MDVQVVAFAQDGLLREPGAPDLMRRAMELGADVVGGIPWIEYTEADIREHVRIVFDLAAEFDKDVSMLVDDAGDAGLRSLEAFNGQQWGAVVCWNPYSSNCNNAMAIAQQDNARVTMFETPYMYNMLDGKLYPLLADGRLYMERCAYRDHLQDQSCRKVERWHPGDRG